MKPLQFNMSKFKKISGDKNSTTMQHDDGHMITIAHKTLPALHRKQLERMPIHEADGGEIDNDQTPTQPVANPDVMAALSGAASNPQKAVKDARKNYAEGGPVVHRDNNPKLQQSLVRNPPSEKQISTLNSYADGTSDAQQDDSQSTQPDQSQSPMNHLPITINVGTQPTPQAPQGPASIYNQQQPQTQVPNIPIAQPNAGLMNSNQTINAPQAVRSEQALAPQQEAIDTAKGKALADTEKGYNDQRAAQAQIDEQHIKDLQQHTDEFANYIANNKIDPNHWADTRALGKTGAAMSLFLSGFAGGLGNTGPMDFINKQIDRDIDAQKARSDQAKTVYGAFEHLYGDQNIASTATKASMLDIYSHKVQQIAQQLATPQAALNAKKFQIDAALAKQQLMRQAIQDPNMDSAYQRSQQVTGKVAPPPQTEDQFANSPLLNPDAENKFKTQIPTLLKSYDAENQSGELTKQYNQAKQADQLLGQLHDLHSKMYEDAKAGGGAGYYRRHDPTQSVPYIGEAIHGAFTQPITATPNNKEYDSLRTRLVGDIGNALKGTNVSGEEIKRMVDDNAPESRDTPELKAQKEKNIRLFIKNAVPRGLLQTYKLSK